MIPAKTFLEDVFCSGFHRFNKSSPEAIYPNFNFSHASLDQRREPVLLQGLNGLRHQSQ